MIYSCDFETTTDKEDCRVWAWGSAEIDSLAFQYGNNIESFISFISTKNKDTFFFHNLKFDGEFIIYYLLTHNFEYCVDQRKLKPNSFNIVMSHMGQFYSMKICFDVDNIVEIVDSLKILPFKVEEIAEKFGIEEQKLEIDYKEKREIGHILTKQEVGYLKNDVIIVAKAIKILRERKLTKKTIASNAMNNYKHIITAKKFKRYFPVLDERTDSNIRETYKGGFAYVNPKIQNKDLGVGLVLDVNSLYPYVMMSRKLPYDYPVYFEGKYEEDQLYALYIQVFRCTFELKPGKIPTIQIKNNKAFKATEYLENNKDEYPVLALTNIDLKLFYENYDVQNEDFLFGYKFKGTTGLFGDYINYWINLKIEADKNHNSALRQICKLMLNSLYGKFGLNPIMQAKYPVIEDEHVKYKLLDEERRNPIYIPMASFITAYAREVTIRAAQANYERWAYSDTDSLHLIGTEPPTNLKVDPFELGAWKIEKEFTRARFLRTKTYIETVDGKDEITGAGMPDDCKQYANWENFRPGLNIKRGKLSPTHVPGGIVLEDIDFTIKM